MCMRAGDSKMARLPAGYRVDLTSCVTCGRPLWISTETKEAVEKRGGIIAPFCAIEYLDCKPQPGATS